MSRTVISIAPDRPIAFAHQLMRERGLQHLPVLDDGCVVGMLTAGDLYLLEATRHVDPDATAVRDVMSRDVLAVISSAPLAEVVRTMKSRRSTCAIVIGPTGMVGIFTAVDALEALAEVLDRRLA